MSIHFLINGRSRFDCKLPCVSYTTLCCICDNENRKMLSVIQQKRVVLRSICCAGNTPFEIYHTV